jgi:hypothetical protein
VLAISIATIFLKAAHAKISVPQNLVSVRGATVCATPTYANLAHHHAAIGKSTPSTISIIVCGTLMLEVKRR